MKAVHLNKDVIVIESFLDTASCSRFIEWSEQEGYEEAKVNWQGRQVMMKNVRDNARLLFKNEDLAASLFERIRHFCPDEIGNARLLGLNELFRFYKYEPGQKFKMHRDGVYERNETEFSVLTLLIYLNETFEGGATSFETTSYQPKTGAAMLFPHPLRHQGDVLISGIKYVLRTDVMYKLK